MTLQERCMKVYDELYALYQKRRKGADYKRLAGRHGSTELYMGKHGVLNVRYYNTDVVSIQPNGVFTLRTGGYKTVSTKDRINGYSPVYVWQKDFEWYVAWAGK